MGFRDAQPATVVLGLRPAAGGHWQAGIQQGDKQRVARGIDCRRIVQRGLGPGRDPGQQLGLALQERLNRTSPFTC
jgi:hypothetical protein